MLEGKGAPSIVERTLIRPPASRLGPVTEEEGRRKVLSVNPVAEMYDEDFDRRSAYEILAARAGKAAQQARPPAPTPQPTEQKDDSAAGNWTLPRLRQRPRGGPGAAQKPVAAPADINARRWSRRR